MTTSSRALLPLLLALTACRDTTAPAVPPVDLVLAAELEQQYQVDAARLALRELGGAEQLRNRAPEIPADLQASIYNALLRVHASSSAGRDRVIEAGIHTFPNPEVFEVIVKVDPAAAWANAWRLGHALTGYRPLDTLVEQYRLSIEHYYNWSGEYVVLRSEAPLNTAGLARLLAGVTGVLAADPNGWIGDYHDITARRDGGGWRLRYARKWGDCWAGCISAHYWEFRVSGAGGVSYLGEGGDELP